MTLQNNNHILNAFQHILSKYEGKSIKLKQIKVNAACKPGDNFMSDIKKVTVFSKFGNKRWHLIMKKQIPNKTRRKLFGCDKAFLNEIGAYNYIVPELQKYLVECYIPKSIYAGPSYLNKNEDWIVLENLTVNTFKMMSKLRGLNYLQIINVMKMLGNFHAASISMKLSDSKTFYLIEKSYLTELLFDGSEKNGEIIEKSIQTAITTLTDDNFESNRNAILTLRNLSNGKLYQKMCNLINNSKGFMSSVICHGDLWVNNILFKNGKNSLEVKLVDLQTLRCCSPVFDLLYFMFSSVPINLHKKHLNEFLQIYHESFLASITFNQAAVTEYEDFKMNFTLESLKREYEKSGIFGLGIALWLLPMITFDPNFLPNLNCKSFGKVSLKSQLTSEYKIKLIEILDYLMDKI
uniref:CSON010766 protein n=1 Tax=Culicoides sonorensis TaxID=179676 RepID=A0A336M2G9_CULSO